MKTVYLNNTYRQKVGHQEFDQKIRLGIFQAKYIAAKKENGAWVGVHKVINRQCICGGETFCYQFSQKNIFTYQCTNCTEEITINSYNVPTPNEPLGRWVKQDGKWFVKVISGDTSKHDEIAIRSSKGLQRKKIKNVSLFSHNIL